MVAYAVYLTYRSEQLKKVLEAGADTIKYQRITSIHELLRHSTYCLRTLSSLNLKPGSSLVALGHSVRRKTMDRLSSNVGGSIRCKGVGSGTPCFENNLLLPEMIALSHLFEEVEFSSKLNCYRRDKEEGEYLVNDDDMYPVV